MKVGILSYDFYPHLGGMGRHVHAMYRELPPEHLLFFSAADNSLRRHVRVTSWIVRALRQTGFSIRLHFILGRLVSEHALRAVNIHCGPGGILLLRRLRIPVVATCHHTYRQQSRHVPLQRWKRILVPLERRTYELADRIICDADDTKAVLVAEYGIPAGKIVVIPCMVGDETFHPLPIAKAPPLVLFVGRIEKRKGVDFLLRAFVRVIERIPDARLTITGDGKELAKMKVVASRLGLEDRVDFPGFVPDASLNILYNRARCVVVPSRFEGFGLSAIEALAAGTRVVGTDVDGLRNILVNPEYGRMVPFGDEKTLAEAIVAELEDPRSASALDRIYRADHFRNQHMAVFEAPWANR